MVRRWLAPRRIAISNAIGHVTAEAVHATEPVPRFADAAMDGYAVKAADVATAPVRLRVTGTAARPATGRRPPFRTARQCG